MDENKEKETLEPIKYGSLEVYEGAKFKTLFTRNFNARKPYAPIDLTKVKAFIPGTIRKIYVKEGQKVKRGDKLLALEAMKMMNELIATMDGIVKTIHVKTGMNVANKQVLVELEGIQQKEREKRKKKK
jgi:biotin carboxyl carrier protein